MKYLLLLFLSASTSYTQEPFAPNNITPQTTLALPLHDTMIFVEKGAQQFEIYNRTIKSTIGPIQSIRIIETSEGKEKIEWYSGKKSENTEVPIPPQTWKEYIDSIPNLIIGKIFIYFMGFEPPKD